LNDGGISTGGVRDDPRRTLLHRMGDGGRLRVSREKRKAR
jgi:hypothetical protein